MGVVEDMALGTDAVDCGEVDVGEDPAGLVEGAEGKDAIVGKAEVGWAVKACGAYIFVDGGGPWGGLDGGGLDRYALAFEGAGLRTDADAIIACRAVGAGGAEQDFGALFGEPAAKEGEFGVVAD